MKGPTMGMKLKLPPDEMLEEAAECRDLDAGRVRGARDRRVVRDLAQPDLRTPPIAQRPWAVIQREARSHGVLQDPVAAAASADRMHQHPLWIVTNLSNGEKYVGR